MRLARLAAAVGVTAALLVPAALLLPAAAVAADGGVPDGGGDGSDVVVTVPDAGQGSGIGGDRVIADAQLRWSVNDESGGASFAGGCNFLSAGRAGSAGSSRLWTESDGLYRSAAGAVRIEKPTAAGGWTAASWRNRCLDPRGDVVSLGSVSSTSGNAVVIEGGTGRVTSGSGLEISWRGSFTVVFYGGLTYWTASDPVLTLDADGDGQLRATASGYAASRDDTSRWDVLPSRTIVLADIRAGHVVAQERGLVATPEYRGVRIGLPAPSVQDRTGADWGAFPQSFVDYQLLTGQSAYWYSSGGARDAAKPANDLYVSYDATAPVAPPPPVGSAAGAAPVNPVRLRPPAVDGAGPAPEQPAAIVGGPAATFLPEREGLVPAAAAALLSPAAAPMLGAVLALLVAVIAVLNMMGLLPWQQGARGA